MAGAARPGAELGEVGKAEASSNVQDAALSGVLVTMMMLWIRTRLTRKLDGAWTLRS